MVLDFRKFVKVLCVKLIGALWYLTKNDMFDAFLHQKKNNSISIVYRILINLDKTDQIS